MNPAQASSLRTVLVALNRTLRDVEADLAIDAISEPLYYWRNTLDAGRKKRIAAGAAETRECLQRIAEEHGFKAEEEDPLREAWGRLNTHWVGIEECRSKGLLKFGPVAPELAARLDPQIDGLAACVNRLLRALENRPPERR